MAEQQLVPEPGDLAVGLAPRAVRLEREDALVAGDVAGATARVGRSASRSSSLPGVSAAVRKSSAAVVA